MPVSANVASYLERHHVAYLEIAHPAAFTCSAVALATHLGERGLARIVAVRDADLSWMLAVVPPYVDVDLAALAQASGRGPLTLASEIEVVRRFGVSELGDAAPFRELSGMSVYVDDAFSGMSHIYFQDGTHRGIFGVRLRDYLRLVKPVVASFGIPGVVNRDSALSPSGSAER